jgi:hypothetical protein
MQTLNINLQERLGVMPLTEKILLKKKIPNSDLFEIFIEYQGWISYSNLCPRLEICASRPSFLHIFSQIWVRFTLNEIHSGPINIVGV